MPFFSVVIPLFNKEKYIKATLESVLNQTFEDFEIIVVNDGSEDKSLELVKSITDKRLKIYSNENKGLSYSRNYGVKKARSNFIAFLDADDLWLEDYLDCIKKLISFHPSSFIFATETISWFKKGKPNLSIKKNNCRATLIKDYFKLKKNIFSYSSVVFHISVFDKVGYFNGKVNFGEEEEFTIKCFLNFDLVYCHEPKVYYLQGQGDQLTSPNSGVNRIIPDYSKYLNENKSNHALKNYINFLHYKLVLLYKMENNLELIKFYKKKINISKLTLIQKIKYHLPTKMFCILKNIYIWFSRTLIHS